ncbi:MAG: T9SS type A sorting domain-containing protein [bacterium]
MKKFYFYSLLICLVFSFPENTIANLITANPENYKSFLSSLVAGDTLYLTAGTYTGNLKVVDRNGTETQPIVIIGNSDLYTTVFEAQSGSNTISITKSSFLVIKNLQLDGKDISVDAVKAEGTAGNWAHHITLEYMNIINYGNNQQIVGISTKCPAWNWIIRKNKIIGAGTGMYLGNSDGGKPFVNGIIENNYIANTIGYNIEIKHQLDSVRDDCEGTAVNGKTIIRHNVFSKESNGSSGSMARPNLLVGGFPLKGWGANDYYEIYGNFFWQNPNEALFQGTGNICLYNNIFVNRFDSEGFRAVYISSQNGVQPQNIKIFHNTLWVNNSSGGIRLYNANTKYLQYCNANAVFAASPITNFDNMDDNITDTYGNASIYVNSPTEDINTLNLYPKAGQLIGTQSSSDIFQTLNWWNKDFNGDSCTWVYRGAYSGSGVNKGWKLQLDTMPSPKVGVTSVLNDREELSISVYPNPFSEKINVRSVELGKSQLVIIDFLGEEIYKAEITSTQTEIDLSALNKGIYFVVIISKTNTYTAKIVKL